ncbi:MAG: hypothetical protein MJZ12_05265 [Prevotella sp.]|nr:hypothetical protein [Prevotella sp.]
MNEQEKVQKITEHLELLRNIKQNGAAEDELKNACDAAMETWGPLAERLGMSKIQHEMLNLAVELGYPEDYKELKQLLQDSEAMCEIVFKTFALPIQAMLDELGIEYTFKYRMKSIYSIWRKMRVDNKHFDDVYDLFATRIVYKPKETITPLSAPYTIDSETDINAVKNDTIATMDPEFLYCWRIYTIISSLYRIHPDRIKNWITHPKPSGYQALQLTVMGPDCNWIEIQIRSERMDYEAEYGSANHWLYKSETAVK